MLFNCFQQLQYSYLSKVGLTDEMDALDLYYCARSSVVIGDFHRARESAKVLSAVGDNTLARFVDFQCSLYQDQDAYIEFDDIDATNFPDIVCADLEFVKGFQANSKHRYDLGYGYFLRAANLYRECRLNGQESISLFNLILCCNHLCLRSELKKYFSRFRRLTRAAKIPAVVLHRDQLLAYFSIDQGRFSDALRYIDNSLTHAVSLGRKRDVGSMVALKAYLLIKQLRIPDFKDIYSEFIEQVFTGDEAVLEIFSDICHESCLDRSLVESLCIRIESLNSVHGVHAYDLLIDKMARFSEASILLEIVDRAIEFSKTSQHSIRLVDFRPAKITALIKLGRFSDGLSVLTSFRSDALLDDCVVRIKKADEYENIFGAVMASKTYEGQEKDGYECARNIQINLERSSVVVGQQEVPLFRKPQVLAALSVLARSKNGVDIGDFFYAMYEKSFDAVRHEGRVMSLLQRCRALVGKDVILRQGGRIFLSPSYSVELVGKSGRKGKKFRQKKILQVMKSAEAPISISELEVRFEIGRRTLQSDLKEMINDKRIKSTGGTKNRVYFCS